MTRLFPDDGPSLRNALGKTFAFAAVKMARDSFYASRFWRMLRKQALERDHYQCTAPGCTRKAVIVDHVVSRCRGGADALFNLRSLCAACDNRIKEDANGVRRRGGSLKGPVGVDGWPVEE